MNSRLCTVSCFIMVFAISLAAQPRRDEQGGWMKPHDENQNGSLEPAEIASAIARSFAKFDTNGDGILDEAEISRIFPPRRRQPRGNDDPRVGGEGDKDRDGILPPFFFDKLQIGSTLSKDRFAVVVNDLIQSLDQNCDGIVSGNEAEAAGPAQNERRPGDRGKGDDHADGDAPHAGPPPSAQFLGAEMRFGDKPVKGHPFSAETVAEDTRLLFDGSTIKNTRAGAIYRDGTGRVRREQTLDAIAGTRILAADDKPQKLTFITDFAAGNQIFLNENMRLARRSRLNPREEFFRGEQRPVETDGSPAGTRLVDGVACNLTRSEHEIPIGRIGNPKALMVITETCYSPELQIVIMSSHRDPVAGLHEFTLRNIKRVEPAPELFAIPIGYKVEN